MAALPTEASALQTTLPSADALPVAAAQPAAAAALDVAERLRLTVSIGVAELVAADTSPQDTMRRADRALYAAKREGRNRVVVAG